MDRRARLSVIMQRDGSMCVWCRRDIDTDLVAATTEHLVPRIKGGPSWLENEVAACRRCNGERGHRTPFSYSIREFGAAGLSRQRIEHELADFFDDFDWPRGEPV